LKQGFNFLKPQVEPPSVWTKVYDWIVGTARVILILVEICVIVALGIRVVLDIQGKQLDSQINNLDGLMLARQNEETKYRDLQDRIASYETIWQISRSATPILDEINKNLPPSARNITITLEGYDIRINGEALNDEIDIMEMILKESPLFSQTKLSRLSTIQEGGKNLVKFDFQSKVKQYTTRQVLLVTPAPAAVTP
jgi:Tfp pilus assembly protein PilN